jgi:hypothetical protein
MNASWFPKPHPKFPTRMGCHSIRSQDNENIGLIIMYRNLLHENKSVASTSWSTIIAAGCCLVVDRNLLVIRQEGRKKRSWLHPVRLVTRPYYSYNRAQEESFKKTITAQSYARHRNSLHPIILTKIMVLTDQDTSLSLACSSGGLLAPHIRYYGTTH